MLLAVAVVATLTAFARGHALALGDTAPKRGAPTSGIFGRRFRPVHGGGSGAADLESARRVSTSGAAPALCSTRRWRQGPTPSGRHCRLRWSKRAAGGCPPRHGRHGRRSNRRPARGRAGPPFDRCIALRSDVLRRAARPRSETSGPPRRLARASRSCAGGRARPTCSQSAPCAHGALADPPGRPMTAPRPDEDCQAATDTRGAHRGWLVRRDDRAERRRMRLRDRRQRRRRGTPDDLIEQHIRARVVRAALEPRLDEDGWQEVLDEAPRRPARPAGRRRPSGSPATRGSVTAKNRLARGAVGAHPTGAHRRLHHFPTLSTDSFPRASSARHGRLGSSICAPTTCARSRPTHTDPLTTPRSAVAPAWCSCPSRCSPRSRR